MFSWLDMVDVVTINNDGVVDDVVVLIIVQWNPEKSKSNETEKIINLVVMFVGQQPQSS